MGTDAFKKPLSLEVGVDDGALLALFLQSVAVLAQPIAARAVAALMLRNIHPRSTVAVVVIHASGSRFLGLIR
jgi:hypothetical protein